MNEIHEKYLGYREFILKIAESYIIVDELVIEDFESLFYEYFKSAVMTFKSGKTIFTNFIECLEWWIKICLNLNAVYHEDESLHQLEKIEEDLDEMIYRVPSYYDTVEEMASVNLLFEDILTILTSFLPDQKQLILFKILTNSTINEIAENFKISISEATAMIDKGLTVLQVKLNELDWSLNEG